jgi:hypothetical protein
MKKISRIDLNEKIINKIEEIRKAFHILYRETAKVEITIDCDTDDNEILDISVDVTIDHNFPYKVVVYNNEEDESMSLGADKKYFEMSDIELDRFGDFITNVYNLYGKFGTYVFRLSSGGGIGMVIEVDSNLAKITKNITDYESW